MMPTEARSDVRDLRIVPMRRRHVRGVIRIENVVYSQPWSPALYLSELRLPSSRAYFLARVGRSTAGYGGLMFVLDEAHVTTLAVDPRWQRKHIGTQLLVAMAREAIGRGSTGLTLEVRESNRPAHDLYRKFGFEVAGRRKGYYPDTNEDALVMWAYGIDDPSYATLLNGIEESLPRSRKGVRELPGETS